MPLQVATYARLAGLGLAALTMGACAQTIAKSRVESALVEAGLDRGNADCMADRMVDRLTLGQLNKLKQLKGEKRGLMDDVSAVRRVGDAEALQVTASSAALCATGLAAEKK